MRVIPLFPLLFLTAVGACVAPPKAPPPAPAAPRPVVAPAPPPAPAADWRDWPRTPGDWHYGTAGNGIAARYTGADGTALATLACDRPARTVTLSVPGEGAAALVVRTTSTTRSLPVAAGATITTATLAVADPLLDAMAFSRGRFTVERAGQPPLVLPAWAEVGRLIGDCRG